MARVKLNRRNFVPHDKIAKGRQIVTAMTNNARFANPNPPPDVATAIDDLEKAFALVQAARSEVTAIGAGSACIGSTIYCMEQGLRALRA